MEKQSTEELFQQVEGEVGKTQESVIQQRLDVADVEAEVAVLEKELLQKSLANQETREVESAFSLVHDQIESEKGGRRV